MLKRIERKKRSREKFKEKQRLQQEIKAKAIEERARKKELKARIVPIPENTEDEFIDSHIKEAAVQDEIQKENEVVQNAGDGIEGFTVLGGESYDKKAKVFSIK